jgi:hypothetical protein
MREPRISSSDIALRRNAFGLSTPLRVFFAATRARVVAEMPWSCMYLLIFIPKNFGVRKWPSSPYHDGHAYRRGSELNAPGRCLSIADGEPSSCSPSRIVSAASASTLAAVAQPL